MQFRRCSSRASSSAKAPAERSDGGVSQRGLQLLTRQNDASFWTLVPMFVRQMALGTLAGVTAGKAMRWMLNRVALDYEGLYPVLSVALVVLTYGVTDSMGGSGFLTAYVSGTPIESDDVLLVLAERDAIDRTRAIVNAGGGRHLDDVCYGSQFAARG